MGRAAAVGIGWIDTETEDEWDSRAGKIGKQETLRVWSRNAEKCKGGRTPERETLT
jgi:hypothetical protein